MKLNNVGASTFWIVLSILTLSSFSLAAETQNATLPFANEAQDSIVGPAIDDDFAAMYINQGMLNGKHWAALSGGEKETYIMAYQDGLTASAIFYIKDKKQREEAIASFPSAGLDVLVKEIDKIYADSRNIKIPIPYALIAVRNKLMGVKQEKIDAYLEYLRDKMNPAEDKTKQSDGSH